ncbi:MAG: epoxyqueuosine reductase QueH [Candidatus Hydrothermarchaeales archaeon]
MQNSNLLLHVCCAPCSTHVVQELKKNYRVTVYFYNPNIHPEREYSTRLEEMKRLSKEIGVQLEKCKYDPEVWFDATTGFEEEPEGGARCPICYRLRLDETARLAREKGFDCFATTLTISPHKDAQVINTIGEELVGKHGVSFYPADFKKKNGFKHSVELSKKHGLYRQDYCGCIYSKKERERERKK